jgi:hypothetical protein
MFRIDRFLGYGYIKKERASFGADRRIEFGVLLRK